MRIFPLLAAILFCPNVWAAATTYYVDADVGNDSNACTSEGSGNACASINGALALADDDSSFDGDIVYVKNTTATYDEIVDATAFSLSSGAYLLISGYNTTPGDNPKGDNRPTINGGNTRANCFSGEDGVLFANFICDDPTGNGEATSGPLTFLNVKVIDAVDSFGWDHYAVMVESSGASSDCSVKSYYTYGLYCHDASSNGMTSVVGYNFDSIIIDTVGSVGINGNSSQNVITNSVVYNTTGDGVHLGGNNTNRVSCFLINSIIDSSGDDGYDSGFTSKCTTLNAFSNMNNTTDWNATNSSHFDWNGTTISSGFNDAANGDFTVTGALQSAGSDMSYAGHAATSYPDVGAIQHEDSGGSGTNAAGAVSIAY